MYMIGVSEVLLVIQLIIMAAEYLIILVVLYLLYRFYKNKKSNR